MDWHRKIFGGSQISGAIMCYGRCQSIIFYSVSLMDVQPILNCDRGQEGGKKTNCKIIRLLDALVDQNS